jgi:tetratricopeptide (TPR) repeat protein
MINPDDPPQDSTSPPAENPHQLQWWKPSLWLPVLAGFGVLQVVLLLLGIGYYIYVDLPESTFARTDAAPWREHNVASLTFKTPADFAKARSILSADTKRPENQNDPTAAYLLAELDNTLNASNPAIQMYQQVIRIADKNWYSRFAYRNFLSHAHAALAILYYEHGKPAQAKSELDAIPDFSETNQANLLQALRDSIESPDRADFHLLLGKELRHQLKLTLASRELQTAERLSPSPQLTLEAANFMKTQMPKSLKELPPMLRYYSLAAEASENPTQAAAFYEQAVQQIPSYEWGYNELAILYRTMKQYDTASDRANRAIAINPDFYNPYLTLGDIALDRTDYTAAIRYFETAQRIIQRFPSEDSQSLNANIENQLGYTHELMNQIQEAAHHYQLAMLAAADGDMDTTADYEYAQEGLARTDAALHKPANDPPQLSWHP